MSGHCRSVAHTLTHALPALPHPSPTPPPLQPLLSLSQTLDPTRHRLWPCHPSLTHTPPTRHPPPLSPMSSILSHPTIRSLVPPSLPYPIIAPTLTYPLILHTTISHHHRLLLSIIYDGYIVRCHKNVLNYFFILYVDFEMFYLTENVLSICFLSIDVNLGV